jgi:hypothetical protein
VLDELVFVNAVKSSWPLPQKTEVAGRLVKSGIGFTVTVAEVVGPMQPLALGVMVYVAVPGLMPSVTVSTCEMTLPVPLIAPLTLEAITVHENVVPGTPLVFVIGKDVF